MSETYPRGHDAPILIYKTRGPDEDGLPPAAPVLGVKWDDERQAWHVEYPGGRFYLGT